MPRRENIDQNRDPADGRSNADRLTRLVINYSRGADFRQPYESTRTTKAERETQLTYTTIPHSNSSVVLIFVKKSIHSSVYSYCPDPVRRDSHKKLS